jgi:hypothetical protein
MEKKGLAGIFESAAGYVINAKPGPDDSAYDFTVAPTDLARNPIVANTAKPAKTPVKQSHETTIHICLLFDHNKSRQIKEKTQTYWKKLLSNLLAAE